MGMLLKNLIQVHVFREEETESIYVGSEISDVYSHSIKATVLPADSKNTSELYGERANNMFTVFCAKSETIGTDNKLSLDGKEKPTHKIISVKRYQNLLMLLAEAVI